LGGPEWDVFDAEGGFLGTVRMPRTFHPTVIRDGQVYGVMTEAGQPRHVARLTLEDRR
jgi:hypothetical protein